MSRTYYVVKEPPRFYYDRFFNAVKNRSVLWDQTNKHYNEHKHTYPLWKEVANISGKKKASQAEMDFVRKRKGYEKYLTGRRDHWPYTRQMAFLGQEIVLLHKKEKKKKNRKAAGADSVETSKAAKATAKQAPAKRAFVDGDVDVDNSSPSTSRPSEVLPKPLLATMVIPPRKVVKKEQEEQEETPAASQKGNASQESRKSLIIMEDIEEEEGERVSSPDSQMSAASPAHFPASPAYSAASSAYFPASPAHSAAGSAYFPASPAHSAAAATFQVNGDDVARPDDYNVVAQLMAASPAAGAAGGAAARAAARISQKATAAAASAVLVGDRRRATPAATQAPPVQAAAAPTTPLKSAAAQPAPIPAAPRKMGAPTKKQKKKQTPRPVPTTVAPDASQKAARAPATKAKPDAASAKKKRVAPRPADAVVPAMKKERSDEKEGAFDREDEDATEEDSSTADELEALWRADAENNNRIYSGSSSPNSLIGPSTPEIAVVAETVGLSVKGECIPVLDKPKLTPTAAAVAAKLAKKERREQKEFDRKINRMRRDYEEQKKATMADAAGSPKDAKAAQAERIKDLQFARKISRMKEKFAKDRRGGQAKACDEPEDAAAAAAEPNALALIESDGLLGKKPVEKKKPVIQPLSDLRIRAAMAFQEEIEKCNDEEVLANLLKALYALPFAQPEDPDSADCTPVRPPKRKSTDTVASSSSRSSSSSPKPPADTVLGNNPNWVRDMFNRSLSNLDTKTISDFLLPQSFSRSASPVAAKAKKDYKRVCGTVSKSAETKKTSDEPVVKRKRGRPPLPETIRAQSVPPPTKRKPGRPSNLELSMRECSVAPPAKKRKSSLDTSKREKSVAPEARKRAESVAPKAPKRAKSLAPKEKKPRGRPPSLETIKRREAAAAAAAALAATREQRSQERDEKKNEEETSTSKVRATVRSIAPRRRFSPGARK